MSNFKLVSGKTVDEMTNIERREAECIFADFAERSAKQSWGSGWSRLDNETRKACVMIEIVKYMSGNSWIPNEGLPRQKGVGWTAEDCWRVLEICANHFDFDKIYNKS